MRRATAGLMTMKSRMKAIKASRNETPPRMMVITPDFCIANRADSGLPSQLGGMINVRTVMVAMMAAARLGKRGGEELACGWRSGQAGWFSYR